MSIKIMSQVWSHGPSGKAELLAMLALADFCDDDGRCYPSVATVAKKARMTPRGFQKIVRKLEAENWLTVDQNAGRGGANVYRLTPERCSPLNAVHPRTPFTPPLNTGALTPEPRSPEPSRTVNEPSIVTPIVPKPDFEEFWQACPKKIGKGAAAKAFDKALRVATHADLISAMTRYRDQRAGQDPQYTVHPATWLNQQRWLDDDTQPENFHDKFEEMLNGLRPTNGIDCTSPERISAPIRNAEAFGSGRGADGQNQDDSGGGELLSASIINFRGAW